MRLEKQLDKNLQVVRGVTLQPVKFDVAGSVVGYYEVSQRLLKLILI